MHLFCISKDDLHLAPECLNWGGGWWGGEGGGGGGREEGLYMHLFCL